MRRLCVACAVGVVLLLSACGGTSGTKADRWGDVPESLRAELQKSLHGYIHIGSPNGKVREVDIYGPDTHHALAQAASGDIVNEHDPRADWYLVVWRGRFVCRECRPVVRGTVY